MLARNCGLQLALRRGAGHTHPFGVTRSVGRPGAVLTALQRPQQSAPVAAAADGTVHDMPTMQQRKEQAVQAAESGNFTLAAAYFAAALQQSPEDAALCEQHAQCLMEIEKYDAAVTAAEKATAIEPQWSDVWTTLARCYLNAGQLNSAQAAFCKALALNPDQPDVRAEVIEVAELAQQDISRRVGLPGLKITADPAGELGPGCVIWEAGIALAQLLVAQTTTNRRKHQQHNHAPQQAAPGAVNNTSSQLTVDPTTAPAAAAAAHSGSASSHSWPPWCTAGARVLEVGSGTGICGITAAALGAHVTLTDLPQLQQLLNTNVAANHHQLIEAAGGSARAAELDWNSVGRQDEGVATISAAGCSCCSSSTGLGPKQTLQQQYDWAMGADLVFNQHQVMPVVQLIASLLGTGPCSCCEPQLGATQHGNSGSKATQAAVLKEQQTQQQVVQAGFLLAHKHRHEHVDQKLVDALIQAGLSIEVVATSQRDEQPGKNVVDHNNQDMQQHQISIWWLTKQCSSKQQPGMQCLQQVAGQTGKQMQQQPPDHPEHVQQQAGSDAQKEGPQQQYATTGNTQQLVYQQQQLQEHGHVHARQPQKLLLLSAGLAGVGKSTILKQLCARLGPSTVYIDKDIINAALLQGRPYFSDYSKQHVQQQAYDVCGGMVRCTQKVQSGSELQRHLWTQTTATCCYLGTQIACGLQPKCCR